MLPFSCVSRLSSPGCIVVVYCSCTSSKVCLLLSDERELAAIGGRDHSLFLFRALGKILYCKRESVSGDTCGDDSEQTEGDSHSERDGTPDLPAHLHHHKRSRLLIDPEVQWSEFI